MEKIKKQIPLDKVNAYKIENFNSTELSQNFNDKTNEIINSFFSIIEYEKIGIVDLLKIDEAMLICDILYVNKFSCQISPKTFLLEHIENSFFLGTISKNYNIEKENILQKLKPLSEHQCYILILLACKSNAEKDIAGNEDYHELIKNNFLINIQNRTPNVEDHDM